VTTLTRCAPVLVKFAGERAGSGPPTYGQRSTLDWFAAVPDAQSWDAQLNLELDLPPGTPLSSVTAALAALVGRHEGLRTRFEPSGRTHRQLRAGDLPAQVVTGSGELTVAVYLAPAAVSVAAVRLALVRSLRDDPQRSDPALPLVVALALDADGGVVAGVLACSHLVADHTAMVVLGREFAALARDPHAFDGAAPAHQPLDRAAVEHARPTDAIMRQLAERLTRMPQCLYARPRVGPPAGAAAVLLRSFAAAVAVDTIAARAGSTPPAVVLAAVCALLSHRTGYAVCEFPVMAGNRHERSTVDYVGTIAQTTLITVEVGTAGFDELTRRALLATLTANRRGCYDVFRRMRLTDRIERERGVSFNFGPVFNSHGAVPAPAPDPVGTTVTWRPMPPSTPVLRFDLTRLAGVLELRLYYGDAGRTDRAEATALVLAVERLLLASAAAPGLDRPGIVAALGIPPLARAADSLLVDGCWVELSAVGQLVSDALSPAVTQVFARVDGRALVAYVAGFVGSATAAHDRCLALLPGRVDAMTPRWYVLCADAPAARADLASWRDQPVRSQGSGR
jgi:hypothetical protein